MSIIEIFVIDIVLVKKYKMRGIPKLVGMTRETLILLWKFRVYSRRRETLFGIVYSVMREQTHVM